MTDEHGKADRFRALWDDAAQRLKQLLEQRQDLDRKIEEARERELHLRKSLEYAGETVPPLEAVEVARSRKNTRALRGWKKSRASSQRPTASQR